jgi:hypothetical protein
MPHKVKEHMSNPATTGNPVQTTVAAMFKPVHLPRFMKHRSPDSPPTFGDEVAVKMSQRTLIIILGATIAAGIAYADLKRDANADHETVVELVAQHHADHDLLVKVSTGVELLQRKADRADWASRAGKTP